jgi:hypothetical protein
MFTIKVKRPQSTAARSWNVAMDVLSPVVVFTPIVLKLTGVIDWSWWWVLSPLWISGILLALMAASVFNLGVSAVVRRLCRRLRRV